MSNPGISESTLPDGLDHSNFRDPKIWRKPDGTYGCVVGTRRENGLGMLQYESADGLNWSFSGVLAENDGRLGLMWECPDFFMLDGKAVVLVSSQDMLPEGFEYHNGNGTGDTFCACVLHNVLQNGLAERSEQSLQPMLRFANAAAYLVTTKRGAIRSMPSPDENTAILKQA